MVRTRSSSVSSMASSATSPSSRHRFRPHKGRRSLSESRRPSSTTRRRESTSPRQRRRRGREGSPSSDASSDSESPAAAAEKSGTPPSSSSVSPSSSSTSPPPPDHHRRRLPPSPPWCCTCLEVGGPEQCNLRRAWSAYARPGEENFSHWLASKHLTEQTAEDAFPIYLLMKLKRTEAAAVLAEMFFAYPPSPKWAAADGHLEPLLVFCRHAGVSWEKPSNNNNGQEQLPSTFSLDPAENYRQFVVEHFKLVVSYLLRHYFYYYNARPRLGVLELCRLLNSMYADLLALNGLQTATTSEFQFYFHAGWLEEFTRQNSCYRRLVVFPPRYEAPAGVVVAGGSHLVETEQTSCTVLVHANKLVAPVVVDPSLVTGDNIWEHCYISQLFYDPFDDDGDGGDLCDCGQAACPGCFAADCLKCGSRKCGVVCRTVTTFFEGDLLTEHLPHLYHWRRQQQQQQKG